MPRTTSDHAFTNSKEWLDTTINISGSKKGGTFESAYRIANHLIKYYKDSFLAVWVAHCTEPPCAGLAREKADSRNAHPDVIANLEVTNKRNKRKYVSEKKVEVIRTRRKRQREMGRFEAMHYF